MKERKTTRNRRSKSNVVSRHSLCYRQGIEKLNPLFRSLGLYRRTGESSIPRVLGKNCHIAGMVRAMHGPRVADFETVETLARAQAQQPDQPSCRTGLGLRIKGPGFEETNASEPLMTCRKVCNRRRNWEGVVGAGQVAILFV